MRLAQLDRLFFVCRIPCVNDVQFRFRKVDASSCVVILSGPRQIGLVCLPKIDQRTDRNIGRPRTLCFDQDHQTVTDSKAEVVVDPVHDHSLQRNVLDIFDTRLRILRMKRLIESQPVLRFLEEVREYTVLQLPVDLSHACLHIIAFAYFCNNMEATAQIRYTARCVEHV